jgi:hypothetical protein
MNFTPKIRVGRAVSGILTIAAVGSIGWGSDAASMPIIAKQNTFAIEKSYQANSHVTIIPAVDTVFAPGSEMARSNYYQPVSAWYKSKHWWKRNAPIIGGAGGGALVGGLVGGGAGAIVGGAVGGGGGYLYKRAKRHHEYNHENQYNYKNNYNNNNHYNNGNHYNNR